jgi:hypothetical protein
VAIIKTIKNAYWLTAILYEDPIPGATNMFIQHDAYDKTTLAYQFDVAMNWNTRGTYSSMASEDGANHSGFGVSATMVNYNSATLASVPSYGAQQAAINILTGVLQLNGETTHVRHQVVNVTAGDYRQNLDVAPFASMDSTRRPKPTNYFTDGTNNIVMGVYHHNGTAGGQASYIPRYWLKINTSSQDLVNSNFVNANTFLPLTLGGVTGGYQVWPLYRNPATNNIVWGGQTGILNVIPYSMRGLIQGPAFSSAPTFISPVTSFIASYSSQFVGVSSADGFAIFLENSALNDYTQNFYKLVDTVTQTVTNTVLTAVSAVPVAAGSSAGGVPSGRGLSFGGNLPKYASSTFAETGSVSGFYLPFLDNNGTYQPFYYQWNRSTDAFTRNSNVTVTYATGTFASYFGVDTQSQTATGNAFGMNRFLWNETFTYSGTRYLMFGQLNGAGGTYDSTPTQRTFVCYSVNAGDPKLLTYHSSLVVPLTPKNIVWLNDARTTVGIITHTNFYIYAFNGTTWTQTVNLPYQMSAVGRDNTGRIWATDVGPLGQGRLHLISPTTPVSITVTPASTNYSYAGSTITSSVAVNAYDSTGTRIAVAVKLVISGASMTFASSNLTTTITTSASADTTVPIYITNGGVSNIIASAAI